MKWRVRSVETGKIMKIDEDEGVFLLTQKGYVHVLETSGADYPIAMGYIVEFAFKRGLNGKWLYTQCVTSPKQ